MSVKLVNVRLDKNGPEVLALQDGEKIFYVFYGRESLLDPVEVLEYNKDKIDNKPENVEIYNHIYDYMKELMYKDILND